tara:strand:- start:599 stop:856 length:258 start_codon:yes stop_codon:yes gene_type:complete
MSYKIVLEAEDGFYKDLTMLTDKKSVKQYLEAFKEGRDRQRLGGQDHLSGFQIGVRYAAISQAMCWGYEAGLTLPMKGKLAVKEV